MNITGQGHSLTFAKATQIQHFQTTFPKKKKNHWTDWSQISYLASIGYWDEN